MITRMFQTHQNPTTERVGVEPSRQPVVQEIVGGGAMGMSRRSGVKLAAAVTGKGKGKDRGGVKRRVAVVATAAVVVRQQRHLNPAAKRKRTTSFYAFQRRS